MPISYPLFLAHTYTLTPRVPVADVAAHFGPAAMHAQLEPVGQHYIQGLLKLLRLCICAFQQHYGAQQYRGAELIHAPCKTTNVVLYQTPTEAHELLRPLRAARSMPLRHDQCA